VILLDTSARPLIAHRGDRAHAPENTLLAFQRAIAAGADAIELDVRVTRDRQVVVIHDETVDRTTNGTGAVATMPLDQLRELDAGRGERIPLLAEVLEQFRATPLIIELKVVEAARPALELVATHHARDRVIFGSFLHAALEAARSAGAFTTASQRELARLLPAAAMRGAPRAVPFQAIAMPPSYYGVPLPIGGYARATNVPVHVWTVNDPNVAQRLRRAGVCGIITDDPAALLRANA
jgi:glycerophosphoryl diester phosphodiesterase